MENFLLNPEHKYITWQRNGVRTVMVVCTFALAQIKEFSVITNLVGIPMSVLAFVLPPLMEIRLIGWANVSRVRATAYIALAAIGLAICIVTTVYSFLGTSIDYEAAGCDPAELPCFAPEEPATPVPTVIPWLDIRRTLAL